MGDNRKSAMSERDVGSVDLEGDELHRALALDLHHDRIAVLQAGDRLAQLVERGHGGPVHRVDDVARLEPVRRGRGIRRHRRHQDAARLAQPLQRRRELCVDVDPQDIELRHEVLLGPHHVHQGSRVLGALDDGHLDLHLRAAAQDVERDRGAGGVVIEVDAELAHVSDGLAVRGHDHVADLDPRLGRRPVGVDVRHDDAPRLRQGERRRYRRADGLHLHPDHAPVHTPPGAQLVHDVTHGVARDRESDALAAPDRVMIIVLMPTTRPLTSTSGPPELPGLIGASVCTYASMSSGWSWRATALITPIVTVFPRPRGEPNANTSSPCLSWSESPRASAARSCAGILINARSVAVSMPTTSASRLTPSGLTNEGPRGSGPGSAGRSTWIRRARDTTCALVTM